tara:strand:- start:789 stop:1697 length:909 start_codon:yes stop_codon:yes gene_type:complete
MNKLITTLAILLSTTLYAQLDITNDFESWTFTNTAGLEPYGAITTTLAGGGAYPNNDTILMTSPLYEVAGDLEIDFKVNGFVERNYDYMKLQYNLGSGWINLKSMTGNKNYKNYSLLLESVEGMIQFRFALVTDHSVNTYGERTPNGCGSINLMYYDVSSWNLWSDNALPVEFGGHESDCGEITFWTESEQNSSHFIVLHSSNGLDWDIIDYINAMGFSNTTKTYRVDNNLGGGFFQIIQVDIDGEHEVFGAFEIDCNLSIDPLHNNKQIEGYYNTMGQKITPDTRGLKIVRYTDGSTKTIY